MAKEKEPNQEKISQKNAASSEAQTMLATKISAQFIYPEEPKDSVEKMSRTTLQNVLDDITNRLQPAFRSMIIEMLDMQHQHFTQQNKIQSNK